MSKISTYLRACNEAFEQTGLPKDTFPQQLPLTTEQILGGFEYLY